MGSIKDRKCLHACRIIPPVDQPVVEGGEGVWASHIKPVVCDERLDGFDESWTVNRIDVQQLLKDSVLERTLAKFDLVGLLELVGGWSVSHDRAYTVGLEQRSQ